MKYCSTCGEEINENAVVCIKCGCSIPPQHTANHSIPMKDEAEVGLIILSALIPIIGLILWALKNKDSPNAAKSYGVAALIVFGIWIAIYIFVAILVSSTVSGFLNSI